MRSRNTSVTVTKFAYAKAVEQAKRTGKSIAEILADAVIDFSMTQKTIESIKSLRSRPVPLARTVAEALDAKIKKVGAVGEVTRSEVMDFILQQSCGRG